MTLVPLKSFTDAILPDSFWTNRFGTRTLEDHHRMIAEIEIGDAVPEPVRQHFENARNVYLYALFAHRLLMVAALQVRVAVEAALLARCSKEPLAPKRSPGLKRLLLHAIKHEWIRDEGFAIHRRNENARRADMEIWSQINSSCIYTQPKDPQKYCKTLANSFPGLRNSLAHGDDFFDTSVLGTFEIAADLINQLFTPAQNR